MTMQANVFDRATCDRMIALCQASETPDEFAHKVADEIFVPARVAELNRRFGMNETALGFARIACHAFIDCVMQYAAQMHANRNRAARTPEGFPEGAFVLHDDADCTIIAVPESAWRAGPKGPKGRLN